MGVNNPSYGSFPPGIYDLLPVVGDSRRPMVRLVEGASWIVIDILAPVRAVGVAFLKESVRTVELRQPSRTIIIADYECVPYNQNSLFTSNYF